MPGLDIARMLRREAHPAEPERGAAQTPFLTQLRDEWDFYEGEWSRAGFRAIVVYRLGYWRRGLDFPWRQLLYLPTRFLQRYVRNHYGIELHPTARIGRRLALPHQHGIVVHHFAAIGDDCSIQQGVTICCATRLDEAPTLGNGVKIGANAVLMGRIHVGDNATIGPNTVVTMDVPGGATVFAPPPRLIPASGDASA
jgi:serine O-acetyltransferase